MLSYRHGYHAGNLADVLKHCALVAVLDASVVKPKPIFYLDTHAGAGYYDLRAQYARSNGEHQAGIRRLQSLAAQSDPPAAVRAYLARIAEIEREHQRATYPSAAALAAHVLRSVDRLLLAERHPVDVTSLERAFAHDRRARVVSGDGYALLKSALPPRERRGIVLIDPSYELEREPTSIAEGLAQALARFRSGTYLIWYPLAGKLDPSRLVKRIERLDPPPTLRIELAAPSNEAGAVGSGVLIVNPPYSAQAPIVEAHAYLANRLGGDRAHRCEWLGSR